MALTLCRSLVALLAFACFGWSDASSFLSRAQEANIKELTPELEASILQEIEEVLGSSSHSITEERLTRIQEMLHATFMSLPKNEQGRLEHTAVRYVLHSYFVQRHAWFVRGLSSLGEEINASSPANILQDKVEDFVQAAFEQRMGSHGLDLKDMAVLAATYENLIHKEMAQRLDATFRMASVSATESMNVSTLDSVMDVYMMGYILNLNYTVLEPRKLQIITSSINRIYPTWPATRDFLRSVRSTSSPHKNYFTRSDVEAILEEVHDQYGHWQDKECQDLKKQLLTIEDKTIGVNGSGRVRISDFYGSAVRDGNWQFSENTGYLTQNGALDTNGIERVIIANYINSPSNCLASSKFYSVCCINECEDLMDHVEHRFAAPSAEPAEIAKFVASLPSSTVAAGRELPQVLTRRLEQIASHHGGQVPLHGRLFAQWLHHAYPRECPYPHMSGTTRPQTVKDYMAQMKQSPVLTKDVLKSTVAAAGPQAEVPDEGNDEVTEWSHQEELYVGNHLFSAKPATTQRSTWSALRPFAYVAAVAATGVVLSQRIVLDGGSKKSRYAGKDLFV